MNISVRYVDASSGTGTATDVVILTSVWIASILIVNPVGEFPLNDDWVYALVVRRFVETGDFQPGWFAAAQLLTNTLWGALFCLPSGFTFTALRVSTLVASLFAILGCYILIREMLLPRWYALVATFCMAFNPIYYALSYTFMTDVLFVALVVWATVFFARSYRNGRSFEMLVGAALAVGAALSRQIALCIPVAFLAVHLLSRRSTSRRCCAH